MQSETAIIGNAIRDIVRAEVTAALEQLPAPDYISIETAAEICDCSRKIIDSLIKEADVNEFPVTQLSAQTYKIDRHELYRWLRNGGLRKYGQHS